MVSSNCMLYSARLEGTIDEKVVRICIPPTDSKLKSRVVVATTKSVGSWCRRGDDGAAVRKKVVGVVRSAIKDMVVTNDGYAMATCTDGSTKVWGADDGKVKMNLLNNPDVGGQCLALTHDGLVVGAGMDGSVSVRTQQGKLVQGGTIHSHKDTVVSVHCSVSADMPYIATASLDGTVKVFTTKGGIKLVSTMKRAPTSSSSSRITSTIISPDGSLCAIAESDGKCTIFIADTGSIFMEYDMESPVSQICFSPNRYWMCAATQNGFKIIDLDGRIAVGDDSARYDERNGGSESTSGSRKSSKRSKPSLSSSPSSSKSCSALCWSADGSTLFAGYESGDVHEFTVGMM